jgi:NADH dehydrogenase
LQTDLTKVVVIGAGFAGLEAAKILSKDPRIHLTMIDRNNYHLFQPLLYQVATAGLSPAEIAMPIRAVLRNRQDTLVKMAAVTAIKQKDRRVILDNHSEVSFDYLILATGLTSSYFGNEYWAGNAPGLKSLEDAIEIRRKILSAFEIAEQTDDPVLRQSYLTFVVVGGGPTGLELAGAIAEIAKYTIARDFVNIKPEMTKIYLVEAGNALLSTFHVEIWDKAKRSIEKLGVEVLLQTRVTDVDQKGVKLGERYIPTRTILWAAGVKPSSLTQQLDCVRDKSGRIVPQKDLSISTDKNIFAIGDIASVPWKDGKNVPGMAPGAMQEGRHAARCIQADLNQKPRSDFSYIDKGSLATIGRASAVCDFGPIRIEGFFAWIIWIFVHIFYLIGFHNRVIVLIRWAWSYVTFQKGTRIITNFEKPTKFTEH